MHSSLYTSVDEKLLALSNNPQDIIQLAVNRATEDVKDLDGGNVTSNPDKRVTISSNTEVILLDSNLNQLVTGNRFLGLDRITFNKKDLNHIRQLHIVNSYGQDEVYRVVLTEMNIDSVSTNIKYAAILVNTSQLEQISQNHEQLIVVVMASFWILSILAQAESSAKKDDDVVDADFEEVKDDKK